MSRGRLQKASAKMKGPVKPAKSKPSVRQKKKKVQPKNDSGTARNVQDNSVQAKRKKVVNNNNLIDVVRQEAVVSQNKIPPRKKIKLDPINVVTPSAGKGKKMPVEVREEKKEKKNECMEDASPFKMAKSTENLPLCKQVYINVTRLDKSSLNEANISIFSSKRKEIVAKKMNEDIEMDQMKEKTNIENLEKIFKLKQIIDKLKSDKVILQDENKSKNEALNSMIKEKEEYKEKFVNEAQKCTEIKDEIERSISTKTMLKSVKEEVEARKNQIERLLSEKDALEVEIKNKDQTLNLVNKDKDDINLKFKQASQQLTCEVQLNHELKEEVEGLKNAVNSMKAKHKIDHDLQNTTIEELKTQAKGLTWSNNQMSEKVVNITKQLDLKGLQTQNFAKQLEEANKLAESLAKLNEEKRREVETLIKLNEVKDKELNIFKKSEKQMEELGLLWRQFKQKTFEVEILLNQTQEKQKQLKSEEKGDEIGNITKQLQDTTQERADSERSLLETSFNEMGKKRDSTLQKVVNSEEDRRIVDENTAQKVIEFQNKLDEEKEISVNKAKKDLEEIQNLKAKLITVKTHFQHFFQNQSPSEDQLSQSSLLKADTNPAHFQQDPASFPEDPASFQEDPASFPEDPASFQEDPASFQEDPASFPEDPASFQEDPASFHGAQSSAKEGQPFARTHLSGVGRITQKLNDHTTSFPDDDKTPDGSESLHRSEQLGEVSSVTLRSRRRVRFQLAPSEQLGEIASDLRDEVMQLLPPIQEKEAEDKRMIGNARQILQDVIEYRKNLDHMKKQCVARLSQVSQALALKNN